MRFSPDRELPVEVAEKIFMLVVSNPCHRCPRECKEMGCNGATTVLTLGRICGEWRDVTRGSRRLWQRIDVTVTKQDHEDEFSAKVQGMQEWLQRSGNLPLTISVHPSGHSYDCPPIPVFKLLTEHSMRWKDIYLQGTGECMQILNEAVHGRTPLLEHVTLKLDPGTERSSVVNFFEDAPHLRVLDYDRFWLRPKIKDRNPWPRLTSLTARGVVVDAIPLMRFTPHLEDLRLEGPFYGNFGLFGQQLDLDVAQQPFSLPKLKSLSITVRGTINNFLPHFNAPSLERLLINDPRPEAFSFTVLNDFVERSDCNLQAFSLALNQPFDPIALQTLLSKMDNLSHLYIGSRLASDYAPVVRKIPKMLDPIASEEAAGNQRVLLPKLQVLHYYKLHPVMTKDMVDMIKHRRNGVESNIARLRVVRFAASDGRTPANGHWKEEIEQGLEVAYDLPFSDQPLCNNLAMY